MNELRCDVIIEFLGKGGISINFKCSLAVASLDGFSLRIRTLPMQMLRVLMLK